MVVCLCNCITENQIKDSISSGNNTVKGLSQDLGIARNCGCCAEFIKQYLEEHA